MTTLFTPRSILIGFFFSLFFIANPSSVFSADIKKAESFIRPDAIDDTVSTLRNKALYFKPTANDKINGTLQVLGIVSTPKHGSIAFQSADTLIYMPQPNYCGARDTVVYFICNGENSCDTATIYIDIACGNVSIFAPVASSDFVTTSKNQSVIFTPSVNDRLNGNLLAIGVTKAPKNGSIGFISVDSLQYVPFLNYCGRDTLIYRICNDKQECDTAFVFFNVLCEAPLSNVPIVVTFRFKLDTVRATSVQIAGDFQKDAGFSSNWDAKATKMQGPINGYYTFTDTILNKIYQYKFLKNDTWTDATTKASNAESARFDLLGCGVANSTGVANRILDLTSYKQAFTKILVIQDWNKCPPTYLTALNITTIASPTEGGKTSGGGLFFTGDTAVLKANVNAGWRFANWTNNGAIISTDSTFKYAVGNSAVALVANFKNISGINELPTDAFSTYPNPTKGHFVISINQDNILKINPLNSLNNLSVFNVLGEIILKTPILHNQKEISMDMSLQPKGIYFIHIQSEVGQLTKKLIID